MPWLETSPVQQRERFIRDHRLELYTTAELCTRYGITRKTGYKWLPPPPETGPRGPPGRGRRPPHPPPPPPPPGPGGGPCAPPPPPHRGPADRLCRAPPRP